MKDDLTTPRLLDLHVRGDPLLLYNVWDASSAKAVESAGARAVATSSAAVARARGSDDGERLPFDELIRCTAQICGAVEVPVTVDMESGYGPEPDRVAQSGLRLAQAGASGCNLEDQVISDGSLFDIDLQCRRIETLRTALDEAGWTFFINARTDVFLREPDRSRHPALLSSAIERGRAYARAGAHGIFAPGLVDADSIQRLVDALEVPVNILIMDGAPSLAELGRWGVARVSVGSGPHHRAMAQLRKEAEAWFTSPAASPD